MPIRAKVEITDPVTQEQLAALKQCTTEDIGRHPDDHETEYYRGKLTGWGGNVFDLVKLSQHEVLRTLSMSVKFDAPPPDVIVNIMDRLGAIEAKITECKTYVNGDMEDIQPGVNATEQVESQQLNSRVHVHVPGLGLLQINDTKYQEDCCTELLQELLEDGWRILAVCPQPDQRRPDYILGRTVTE